MKLVTITKEQFNKTFQSICDSGDLPSNTGNFREWLYNIQFAVEIPYYSVLNRSEIPALWEMYNSRVTEEEVLDQMNRGVDQSTYEY